MDLNTLHTISPIDGRYSNDTFPLRNIFSEFSFLKYRIYVEIQWFKKIISMPQQLKRPSLNDFDVVFIDNIY
ncbi:MAG: adenylosuccinate lyase, partial [Buchnera aphidicola]|nr:adenylosuccinate lyase [Buchnera aphidicola]